MAKTPSSRSGARPHDNVDPEAGQEQRVVILGLARQGKALARHFAARGASVVVSDVKPASQLTAARRELADLELEYELGGHPDRLLDGADLLCLSGAVPADLPLVQQARQRGIRVSNDSQIFLQECPAVTVGITGSAGKSTTTALVGRMAKAAGRTTWVGGNIGRPLLGDLTRMAPDHLAVMELSSFQLELMTRSPDVAALLNVTPNHLDRHGTLANYREAKARILAHQRADDSAVLGHDDPVAWGLQDRVQGRLLSFGREAPPKGAGAFLRAGGVVVRTPEQERVVMAVDDFPLRGEHNRQNLLAACAVALALGLPIAAMAEAAKTFEGLPHRLENVRRLDDVDWIDDSIATTPERALAGLRAFERPLVLLLGGRDKGLSWSELAQAAGRRARHVIAFGECAEQVAAAVRPAMAQAESVEVVAGLEQAVAAAARTAQAGEVVLLSPGGTSFDAYPDFEARGEHFRALVEAL